MTELHNDAHCPAARPPERIETPRLVLLKPQLRYGSDFSAGMNDPVVSRNTASFPQHVPELAGEFWMMKARANFDRGISYPYLITDKESDALYGVMDIFTNKSGAREIGYWIARPAWGRGFATEAGHAVIISVSSHTKITQIEAGAFYDNPGSFHVLEKLGFKYVGDAAPLFSLSRGRADPGRRYIWSAPK